MSQDLNSTSLGFPPDSPSSNFTNKLTSLHKYAYIMYIMILFIVNTDEIIRGLDHGEEMLQISQYTLGRYLNTWCMLAGHMGQGSRNHEIDGNKQGNVVLSMISYFYVSINHKYIMWKDPGID